MYLMIRDGSCSLLGVYPWCMLLCQAGSLTFFADQRRWNNIAIGLTKLGMPDATIRDAVRQCDETVLTEVRLDAGNLWTAHHNSSMTSSVSYASSSRAIG